MPTGQMRLDYAGFSPWGRCFADYLLVIGDLRPIDRENFYMREC